MNSPQEILRGSFPMEGDTMERIETIRKTHENCRIRILAIDQNCAETVWDGMIRDCPIEYDRIPVLSESRTLGEDMLLLIVPLEIVYQIRDAMAMLRKQIRKALILNACGAEYLIPIGLTEGVISDEK